MHCARPFILCEAEYGVLPLASRSGEAATPPVSLLISGTQAARALSDLMGTTGMVSYTLYKMARSAVAGIGVSDYRRTHGLYMARTLRLPGHTVVILAGARERQSKHAVAL